MRIITSFATLDFDSEIVTEVKNAATDMNELRYLVLEGIKGLFEDSTNDPDTFIAPIDFEDNFVFGALDPQKVIEIAENWNLNIKKQFIAALGKLGATDAAAPEQLPLDTPETYDMQKAARELDNNWWCYANHGVCLPNSCGYPYFKVTLDDSEAAAMIAHPENYIIYDAYVKD